MRIWMALGAAAAGIAALGVFALASADPQEGDGSMLWTGEVTTNYGGGVEQTRMTVKRQTCSPGIYGEYSFSMRGGGATADFTMRFDPPARGQRDAGATVTVNAKLDRGPRCNMTCSQTYSGVIVDMVPGEAAVIDLIPANLERTQRYDSQCTGCEIEEWRPIHDILPTPNLIQLTPVSGCP